MGTPASPAMALANKVLPVPGGPTSKAPLGIFPPSLLNFLDLLKILLFLQPLLLPSSTPATSLKVTLPFNSFIIFAFRPAKAHCPTFSALHLSHKENPNSD